MYRDGWMEALADTNTHVNKLGEHISIFNL